MWDALGVLALRAAAVLADPRPRLLDERPPLPRSIARLVAFVTAGSVAVGALAYAVGRLAVDLALDLIG
jgi:hypothetical protein